jgi:uncharacterized protein YeeX (DUF496 family)
MGRLCLTCDKEIIIGKTIFDSEMYEGLKEVIIHVECSRCQTMKKRLKDFTEKRKELGRQYREITKRMKTYKDLLNFLKTEKQHEFRR